MIKGEFILIFLTQLISYKITLHQFFQYVMRSESWSCKSNLVDNITS